MFFSVSSALCLIITILLGATLLVSLYASIFFFLSLCSILAYFLYLRGFTDSMSLFNLYHFLSSGSGHFLWPVWGLKRKYYVASKKFYPTVCFSQSSFTPPKENSRVRLLLRFDMVYAFTLPLCSKIILLPHLAQPIFSVTLPFYLQSPSRT